MASRALALALAALGVLAPADGISPAAETPAAQTQTVKATPKKKEAPLTPGGKWRAHDMARPRPKVVEPGPAGAPILPPSDAVLLFNGRDFEHWRLQSSKPGEPEPPKWKLEGGYMEVVPKSGSIVTKDKFGDCQIHLEWATPSVVQGESQGRGNSGILLGAHGEIQVLDSYQNDTYPDGQAGALYGKYPPLVNASRPPGQWQTYDILFEAPRLDAQGQVQRPARLTVWHNGIVIHHGVETSGRTTEITLGLQNHNNPVRYRNIWVRKLTPPQD